MHHSLALTALLPAEIAWYAVSAVVVHAGGAVGDLWMVAVALKYPPSALVRDEADRIRIYTQRNVV
jgi:hypothetical protein